MSGLMRAASVVALVLMLGACRDHAREDQAKADARDQAILVHVVDLDAHLDRAMKEADDASRAGEDERAASILETSALPGVVSAIAETEAHPPESAWARSRQQTMLGVLRARREEIPNYVAALRGTDLDAKLAAVEAQLALQKRAIDAATTALQGPPDAGAP